MRKIMFEDLVKGGYVEQFGIYQDATYFIVLSRHDPVSTAYIFSASGGHHWRIPVQISGRYVCPAYLREDPTFGFCYFSGRYIYKLHSDKGDVAERVVDMDSLLDPELSYRDYREQVLNQISAYAISTYLKDRVSADDHHVVMTGSAARELLPLIVGPTITRDALGSEQIASKHVIQHRRGGGVRLMKLDTNPIHVCLSGDQQTFWAVSRREAYQIDLDV